MRGRQGSSPGNSPSRNRPARRQAPNGRTACPCRATSRFRSPTGRAARESAKPGGARPVEAFIAWPKPSDSRRGRLSGPRLKPSRSPSPSAQACRDMAERVRALVAIRSRVLGAAAADRVENDQDRAGHRLPSPTGEGLGGRQRSPASSRHLREEGAPSSSFAGREPHTGRVVRARSRLHWLTTTASSVASLAKAAANRACVYSFCGARKTACASPLSTTLPRRITMISLASARTTLRSWEMNR